MRKSDLVLRTVFIPSELDSKFSAKDIGLPSKTSQNDIIKAYLEFGVAHKNEMKKHFENSFPFKHISR
jgi:hypothetical protein